MNALKFFLYLTYVELLLLIITAVYIFNTQNLELGALVLGFVFFVIYVYYAIYAITLTRYLKNERGGNGFLLLVFNILPLFFLFYLLF